MNLFNKQRKINEIIVHCSATRDDQNIDAEILNKWHKAKKFDCIGYHFVIKRDGTIEKGRDINKEGAHCYGHNKNSIGICYAGGIYRSGDEIEYVDNRTPEQIRALYYLITVLAIAFPTITKVSGHCEYANKACPCFDASGEYQPIIDRLKEVKYV